MRILLINLLLILGSCSTTSKTTATNKEFEEQLIGKYRARADTYLFGHYIFDAKVKEGPMSIDAINFTIPTEDEDIKFTFIKMSPAPSDDFTYEALYSVTYKTTEKYMGIYLADTMYGLELRHSEPSDTQEGVVFVEHKGENFLSTD